MTLTLAQRGLSLALFAAAVFSLAAPRAAADPPARDDPTPTGENAIKEQTVYIPYTKLREIFEKEGRGVFLPYEEFQKLWRAARDKTPRPLEDQPPVDALIAEAEHEATVTEDVVRVQARLKIELLAKGWNEVPLRLADAAITKATLGGKPARIVFEPGVGYKLLVERKDRQAGLLDLSLEYVKAFQKTPGLNSVSFEVPQAPVSRWRIVIPEADVKVGIHPLIAATAVSRDTREGESKDETPSDESKGETVVLAFVGAAPTVRFDWTPKSEGATGLEVLANVRCEQQVTLNEGVMRTRTRLLYTISRAELSQLVIEVPAEHKVVNIFDPNIRQWSVASAEGGQRITAQLFEPAKETQDIVVELERFTRQEDRTDLRVPTVRALGAARQQGVVVVEISTGLRAEVTRHIGLMQIDASDLPESLSKGAWRFAYRYVTLPFDLSLRVEEVLPRITVDSLVEASLEPEQLTLDMLAIFNIERAGVFKLELDIPEGYEVRHVRGPTVAGAESARVDTTYLEGDPKTHLVVNLSHKAFGRVALAVRLHKRLAEPDLLSPTSAHAEIRLELPRITAATVERASGRLLIHAPESLRVNPLEMAGLRSISFKEALADGRSVRDNSPSASRPVLAFAYTREDVNLTLAAERRKPHVTVGQLLMVQVEAGVVKYEASFFHDIRYSGVKSLRIDVPAGLADQIRNKTPGVRDKEIEPPPEDLPEGYVAWALFGETEFLGDVTIRLAWEEKIEKLEVGKSVELAIPHMQPRAVDRAWGQIVLAKTETIDVQAVGTPRGIRPIDPQHDLMAGAEVSGGALAFEFHDAWALNVTATRYQLEEVKRTSIERAVLQMVVTRSGQTSVRALYRMRSARQRLAVQLPPGVDFDNEPLRINGRPIPLERGDKNDFFIPLAGQSADKPFFLELRYSITDGGMRFECPVFPSEPAVQKAYLLAYLPEELALLGSTGPWTSEQRWRWEGIITHTPHPRRHANDLLNWVVGGVDGVGAPSDTFQVDGRAYLFSTLRPAAGDEGALHLIALDEDWLSLLILAPVLAVGLLLLRRKWTTRLLAAGVFVVLLVLMGVFFQTLFKQVVNDRLLGAAFIVALVWMIHYIAWIRPNDPTVAARRDARQAVAASRVLAKTKMTKPPEPTPEKKTDKNEGGRDNA